MTAMQYTTEFLVISSKPVAIVPFPFLSLFAGFACVHENTRVSPFASSFGFVA